MTNDNTSGTSVPVGVNTAKALAELRALAAAADTARASMAGLPPPGTATPASLSTRLAPMPRASVGGRSPAAMKKANQAHVTALRQMRRENGVLSGTIPVHIPSTGPSAAGAAAKAGPRSSMFLTPGASSEASMSAWAQHRKRLNKSFSEGLKLEAEGLRYGVFSPTKDGLGLTAAFARLLGPAVGYIAAAENGLQAGAAVSQGFLNAIEESSRTGRPVSEVAYDAGKGLLRDAGFAVHGATEDLVLKPIRTIEAGLFAGFALLAGRQDIANEVAFSLRVANNDVQDAFRKARGERTSSQVLADSRTHRERMYQIAINESKRQAENDAERVAQQLLGMGFPGTLMTLKGDARADVWTKYEPALAKLRKDQAAEDAALRNGFYGN